MSRAVLPDEFRVVAWSDAPVDALGFGPGHPYTEEVWLPRLGPTSFLMWRYLCRQLHTAPRGCTVPVSDMARALGLGTGRGGTSPVRRSLARLDRFDVVRIRTSGLTVRRRLPMLTPQQVAQLPASVRRSHRQLTSPTSVSAGSRHGGWKDGRVSAASIPGSKRS